MTFAAKAAIAAIMANVKAENVNAVIPGTERSVDIVRPCFGLITETSSDYLEFGPFILLHDKTTNIPITAYKWPIYYQEDKNNYACLSNLLITIVLYTGRRWYDTLYCMEEVLNNDELTDTVMKYAENVHAYWDNILEGPTSYFSEATNSYLLIRLQMFAVRNLLSKGSYAPFGAHYPLEVTYKCLDVKCAPGDNVCRYYGLCQETVSEVNDQMQWHHNACSCLNYSGGFCFANLVLTIHT